MRVALQRQRVRFKAEPVELTLQTGVTRTGKGAAGVKWHVLTLAGERTKQTAVTQMLTLKLAPVLLDEQGNALADAEQLISDRDEGEPRGGGDEQVRPEPA